ncbi:MAG TPA: serine/threonine-protein kinase [Gemmataceae bacterium]|nr:serine/threonine-protein kinase [Gemmataceae bacterium]
MADPLSHFPHSSARIPIPPRRPVPAPASSTSASWPGNSPSETNAATPPSFDAEALVARLTEEMAKSWSQGTCVLAEELLALYPELWDHPEAAVDLILEEVCLRRDFGQDVVRAEILRRFPQWQAQLEILLDCHQILEESSPPSYPAVGESVGDFRLLAMLGQGGHGCVFLATQISLANRPVVLKFTPRLGQEHLSLARLQHTHIMPLFSVLEDSVRNLRALCMPYFGGATLGWLLTALAAQPAPRRTGQDLVRALDKAQAAAGVEWPSRDPARQFLAQASYVHAICWIGACLADALKYAHERGLVHLDVKPSNVLLTADAQPMLLDFHLAHEMIEPGEQQPKWIGGTPTYMSPEQQVALADLQNQRPISVRVDGRSDLYSLGLLLYEALGGPLPASSPSEHREDAAGRSHTLLRSQTGRGPSGPSRDSFPPNRLAPRLDLPRLNKCNPHVGAGVADILAKCLALDPRDRYPDAGALATDLFRHLTDLPLRGVSNRSPSERWRKWRRRRPHALTVLALVLLALLAGAGSGLLVFTHVRHQLHHAQAAMTEGDRQLEEKQYDAAIATFAHGLSQIESLPGTQDLAQQLNAELRRAQRAQAARELHHLADRFRLLYEVNFLPPAAVSEIETSCGQIWAKRFFILNQLASEPADAARTGSSTGPLPSEAEAVPPDQSRAPQLEQRVQADLLDLAILYTNLRVRRVSKDRSVAVRRRALRILDEAETICGASAVLCYERQRQAEALGLQEMAQAAARRRLELAPRTAWEHYALGRALLESGKLAEADALLQKAVELEPKGLWPRFYQGICAYRVGRYEDAVLAFTTCAALAPEDAGCLYNRALAYQAWGRLDRALRDYDAALQLDPHLGVAALNRGILHCQEKRYPQACADLEHALETGVDPATVHYNLALVHLAQEQRSSALTCLECTLKYEPGHQKARALYESLRKEARR